jgi:SAM-dependent methyltransferase
MIACIAGTAAVAASFDPQKLASSAFRLGKANAEGTVLDIAHGKTATISIERSGEYVTIKTNGKTDAMANIRSRSRYGPDEVTMIMLGAIPLMLHDAPRRVANIGLGSGITAETILADPRVERLDTIEIEPKVVELAKHFADRNQNVYKDPRSVVHIDDAKSFFAANGKTYDLVVSEPSDPWVSGVSSLFSVEFYRHVARFLNEGGLFAQWLPIYETNPDRVASVLKAMDWAFDDYLVVALDQKDILLIAKPRGKVALQQNAYAQIAPKIRDALRQIDVAAPSDIVIRIIGNKALFKPWLEARQAPANSDFFPYLDVNADRDRFLGKAWLDISALALSAFPLAETFGARPPLPTPSSFSNSRHFGSPPPWIVAQRIKQSVSGSAWKIDARPFGSGITNTSARGGIEILDQCATPPPSNPLAGTLGLASKVIPYLSPTEGRGVLAALDDAACLNDLRGAEMPWRELLTTAADRNAGEFGKVADTLLESGQGSAEDTARYLLGMALLGRIAAREHARAETLWKKFSGAALDGKPPDLALEILGAHALAPSSRQ